MFGMPLCPPTGFDHFDFALLSQLGLLNCPPPTRTARSQCGGTDSMLVSSLLLNVHRISNLHPPSCGVFSAALPTFPDAPPPYAGTDSVLLFRHLAALFQPLPPCSIWFSQLPPPSQTALCPCAGSTRAGGTTRAAAPAWQLP